MASFAFKSGDELLPRINETAARLLCIVGLHLLITTSGCGSSIHKLAASNDAPALEAKLSECNDVDKRDGSGWTALHHAAENGSVQSLRVLLESNASATAEAPFVGASMHIAAWKGELTALQELLSHGVPVDLYSPVAGTALWQAARWGRASVARFLIEHDADVDLKYCDSSPLHIAAMCRHHEVVEVLLSKRANVRMVDSDGRTALHVAAMMNDVAMVELLLNANSDPHATTMQGDDVLAYATKGLAELIA